MNVCTHSSGSTKRTFNRSCKLCTGLQSRQFTLQRLTDLLQFRRLLPLLTQFLPQQPQLHLHLLLQTVQAYSRTFVEQAVLARHPRLHWWICDFHGFLSGSCVASPDKCTHRNFLGAA